MSTAATVGIVAGLAVSMFIATSTPIHIADSAAYATTITVQG
jgi:hypothetical protein